MREKKVRSRPGGIKTTEKLSTGVRLILMRRHDYRSKERFLALLGMTVLRAFFFPRIERLHIDSAEGLRY
jgi:hypothetical protein